jgi:two-component system sensor kinase FixL
VTLRKFGLDFIGNFSWGTNFCQLYKTTQDLIDIMAPYFAEGLRNNAEDTGEGNPTKQKTRISSRCFQLKPKAKDSAYT